MLFGYLLIISRQRRQGRMPTPEQIIGYREELSSNKMRARLEKVCYLFLAGYPGLVGDVATASEDLVSEALVRASRSLPRFYEMSSLYTWVYRIALNGCKNHIEKLRVREENELDWTRVYDEDDHPTTLIWKLGDNSPAPASRLDMEIVCHALARMKRIAPTYYWAILARGGWDSDVVPYEVAAAHLGITPQAYKSRLFRAREMLRSILSTKGIEVPSKWCCEHDLTPAYYRGLLDLRNRGYSTAEIARRHGVSESCIQTRLQRAKTKMVED